MIFSIFVLFCFANIHFLIFFFFTKEIWVTQLLNFLLPLLLLISALHQKEQVYSRRKEQKVNFPFPYRSNKNIYEQEKFAGN